MSVWREALGLPGLFLTVVLAGGLRLGDPPSVAPPTLFSLVLGSVLVAVLAQSGVIAPARLMAQHRSALANLNGLTILITLFVATAQILTLVSPESGLPSLVFNLFLLVAVLQLLAASLDRRRVLRVLTVLLGAAFTLKFIVLAALSAPATGRVARALQLLFEGITLGTIGQDEIPPAAGYLAVATLAAYLIGLALLPAAGWVIVRAAPPALPPESRRTELES